MKFWIPKRRGACEKKKNTGKVWKRCIQSPARQHKNRKRKLLLTPVVKSFDFKHKIQNVEERQKIPTPYTG